MKQKYLKANPGRFKTKHLRKPITKRFRLETKFLHRRTEMSRRKYNKKLKFLC